MKQNHFLPILTTLICSSLLFSGCIKSNEYLQKLDDIGKSCRIKTFIYTSFSPEVDTLSLHYNILGDLDSATYPQGSTQPNFYFRYDNHRRLLDFVNAFHAGNGLYWFRYFYPNEESANASTDTLYMSPAETTNWPPPINSGKAWTAFEYDSLGRLSFVNNNGSEPVSYSYDARGNLIIDETFLHGPDDKINLNRTNRVLQFLDQDYSVNNLFIANAYNSYGLPTDITIVNVGAINFLGFTPYKTAKVEYECK